MSYKPKKIVQIPDATTIDFTRPPPAVLLTDATGASAGVKAMPLGQRIRLSIQACINSLSPQQYYEYSRARFVAHVEEWIVHNTHKDWYAHSDGVHFLSQRHIDYALAKFTLPSATNASLALYGLSANRRAVAKGCVSIIPPNTDGLPKLLKCYHELKAARAALSGLTALAETLGPSPELFAVISALELHKTETETLIKQLRGQA